MNALTLNALLAEIGAEIDGWQPFEIIREMVEEEEEAILDEVSHFCASCPQIACQRVQPLP